VAVPELVVTSEAEKRRYENAGRRRELRLFRSGRIGPEDAPNLASYLNAFKTD